MGPTIEQQRILLIGAWLRRYAQVFPMYGKTLEQLPDRFEAFESALADIDPAVLEDAFKACLRTCREFPTPADVRAQIVQGHKTRDDFDADKAWEQLQQMLRRHWYGELMPIMAPKVPENYNGRAEECRGGFLLHPPPFDAATDYSIRICGGLERIVSSAGTKELDFIRRDFLTSFKRHRETVGLIAPTREEARQFLDKLNPKSLPEAKEA